MLRHFRWHDRRGQEIGESNFFFLLNYSLSLVLHNESFEKRESSAPRKERNFSLHKTGKIMLEFIFLTIEIGFGEFQLPKQSEIFIHTLF